MKEDACQLRQTLTVDEISKLINEKAGINHLGGSIGTIFHRLLLT